MKRLSLFAVVALLAAAVAPAQHVHKMYVTILLELSQKWRDSGSAEALEHAIQLEQAISRIAVSQAVVAGLTQEEYDDLRREAMSWRRQEKEKHLP
jgi:hypothetical protein